MHKLFEGMAKGSNDPFGGHMANAQHLWSMLDEMSEANPEEYEAFIKGQMETAKKHARPPPAVLPQPGFCARLRLRSGTALLVNVCAHTNVKPPSETPDGSIPLCVGVPRPCEHRGQAAHTVDVLVNGEVVDRAATNASYREELASLASAAAGSNRSHRTRGAASHGLSRHATGRLLAWQGAVRGRGAG